MAPPPPTSRPTPPAALRWRWLCCWLVLVLPLQSAGTVALRAQGPSHAHVPARPASPVAVTAAIGGGTVSVEAVRAALRQGHGSRQPGAAWFSGWRTARGAPLQGPATHTDTHTHAEGERHHHAAADASVVPVKAAPEPHADTSAARDGPVWAPPGCLMTACVALPRAGPAPRDAGFASHITASPDRPPPA